MLDSDVIAISFISTKSPVISWRTVLHFCHVVYVVSVIDFRIYNENKNQILWLHQYRPVIPAPTNERNFRLKNCSLRVSLCSHTKL